MAASLPPELLTPEDREARALELEHQVTREWIRFAILDNGLILAVVVVGLLYALADDWVIRRIRPLQARIAELRSAQ